MNLKCWPSVPWLQFLSPQSRAPFHVMGEFREGAWEKGQTATKRRHQISKLGHWIVLMAPKLNSAREETADSQHTWKDKGEVRRPHSASIDSQSKQLKNSNQGIPDEGEAESQELWSKRKRGETSSSTPTLQEKNKIRQACLVMIQFRDGKKKKKKWKAALSKQNFSTGYSGRHTYKRIDFPWFSILLLLATSTLTAKC